MIFQFNIECVHSHVEIADKYQIVQRLGKQSKRKFGEVFLVEDKSTGEKAVMKVAHQGTNVDRLRQEANFNFNCIGLPKTIHFEENDQGAHYIRRYETGVTLDNYWEELRKRERLPFLVSLFQSLNPIFKLLEQESVIHCDIKPSNILIEETNSGIQAHLIDFGLAINQGAFENRKTIFPLGFAAPELLLNQLEIVDTTTDIYALGITLWRLYTGKLPLTHPNPSVFTNLQLTHPIQDHPELPTRIFKVVAKMCHKHAFKIPPNKMEKRTVHEALISAQKERYKNIQEVLADLINVQKRKWW